MMGRQIVKQPDGLYACWSTIVDDFIANNMTENEYIEFRANEVYENKKMEMTEIFENPMKNKSAFMDFDECTEILNERLDK
jgi:hypothetical protein